MDGAEMNLFILADKNDKEYQKGTNEKNIKMGSYRK